MTKLHPLYHIAPSCDSIDELQGHASLHILRCVEASWIHTAEGRKLATAVFADMHTDEIVCRFDYR